jgi:hypothetical protein
MGLALMLKDNEQTTPAAHTPLSSTPQIEQSRRNYKHSSEDIHIYTPRNLTT